MNMRELFEARRMREEREMKMRERWAAFVKIIEIVATIVGFSIAMWCAIQVCLVGSAAVLLIGGLK